MIFNRLYRKKRVGIFFSAILLLLGFVFLFSCGEELSDEKPSTQTQSYTVQFMIGEEIYEERQVEEGRSVEYPEDPTREGYEFLGWYLQEELQTEIVDLKEDICLTAGFTPCRYTIIYENTLDAENTNPTSYTIEEGHVFTPLSKSGYTFTGWTPAEIEMGTTGEVIVTAQWEEGYSIVYENTFEARNDNPESYLGNEEIIFTPIEREGYIFTGWTPAKIEVGATGDQYISANWEKIEYDIVYVGASDLQNTNPITYTIEDELIFTPLSKTGYTFTGWTPTKIEVGTTGTQTITANWRANTYTVSFLSGEGNGNMTPQTVIYDQPTTLSENAFTCTDYVFVCWTDLLGNTYNDGEEILNLSSTQDENIILTAQWTPVNLSTPKFGFDLSNVGQSGIDLDILTDHNASFVILRGGFTGSDGTMEKDLSFDLWYSGAKQRGVDVGVYWYSRADSYADGKAEAEFVYNNCLKGKRFEYPIYIDIEDSVHTANIANTTDAIKGFCEYLTEKNYLVGLYTYQAFTGYIDMSQFTQYEYWLAAYVDTPSKAYPYGMWQWGGDDTFYCTAHGHGGTSCGYSACTYDYYGDTRIGQYCNHCPYPNCTSFRALDSNWVYKDYPSIIKSQKLNGYEYDEEYEVLHYTFYTSDGGSLDTTSGQPLYYFSNGADSAPTIVDDSLWGKALRVDMTGNAGSLAFDNLSCSIAYTFTIKFHTENDAAVGHMLWKWAGGKDQSWIENDQFSSQKTYASNQTFVKESDGSYTWTFTTAPDTYQQDTLILWAAKGDGLGTPAPQTIFVHSVRITI